MNNFAAHIFTFSIDSGYLEAGADNPAYVLWEIIRNISNILLIITLLVVVFSQLTGFGIDNYGIKKILPKLIINILLINLSFIICQILVDLSNLLGYGIKSGLYQIARDMAGGTEASPGVIFMGILKGMFAAGAAAGAVAGGIAVVKILIAKGVFKAIFTSIGGWVGIVILLLPFIISLLAAIGSFIVFLIMMSMRELIVVVCVAVSPLAFWCLIFPNTESLFKKWFNAFKAVLLVFPICGALRGLSHILFSLVIQSNVEISFMQLIVALVCRILPLFLAPTLVRRSLGALSKFGDLAQAKIKNLGQKGRNFAKNTSTYRNAQAGAKKGITQTRFNMNNKKLDDLVNKRNYVDENGKKITSYADLLKNKEQLDKFMKDNNNFSVRNAMMQNSADKSFLENYEKGLASGAYATIGATEASNKESWYSAEKGYDDQMNWDSKVMQEVEEDPENEDDYAKDANGKFLHEKDENGNDKVDSKTGKKVRAKKAAYQRGDGKWYDSHTNQEITDTDRIRKLENIKRGIPNREMPTTYNLTDAIGGPKAEKRSDGKWVYADGSRQGDELSMDDLEKVEKMVEKDKRKALGGRVNDYISDGKGDYVDRFGNSLGARIGTNALGVRESAGAYQTYSDLMRAKSAGQRASELNNLVGSYAGQTAEGISRASGIIAHDDGLSATNAMLGKATTIESRNKMGYATATTQLAGAIAAEGAIDKTISGNISAMEQVQVSIDAEAKRRVGLNLKQHVLDEIGDTKINNLYNSAIGPNGIKNLKNIASDTTGTYSRYEQAIAQGILNQTNNGVNLKDFNKENIKELVEGRVIPSMTSELNITAQQQTAIQNALAAGRLQEDIISSPTASKDMKNIAQTLINMGNTKPMSSGVAKAYSDAVKLTNVDDEVTRITGNGFADRITQQTANIQHDYDTENLSRIAMSGLSSTQVADRISAGSTQATNQFKTSLAQNTAGEVGLDLDVEQAKQNNRKIDVRVAQNAYNNNIDKLDARANPTAEENARKNATTRVFVESMKNSVPVSEPDYKVIMSGEESRQRSRRIEDIKNAILSSNGYDLGGGLKVEYGDLKQIQSALEYYRNNGRFEDEEKVLALMQAAKTAGSDGIQTIYDTISKGFVDSSLYSAVRNNVISDPNMKAADVAFFKEIMNTTVPGPITPSYTKYVGSMKNSYVGKMTDSAFDSTFGAFKSGVFQHSSASNPKSPTGLSVAKLAYDTLNNPESASLLKQNQKEVLRAVVNQWPTKNTNGEPI